MKPAITLLLCSFIPVSLGLKEPPPPRAVRLIDATGDLSRAIAKLEGWGKPGTRPRRLHNPGALVFAHQRGARRGEGGFAAFLNDELGWRALDVDNRIKKQRGLSNLDVAYARCGPRDDCARYAEQLCNLVDCSE